MTRTWARLVAVAVAIVVTRCTPDGIDADTVLAELDRYAGQRVTIRGRFKSGARCRPAEGEWQTYCKGECQYCKGPLVLDTKLDLPAAGLDDWPLILGGTHEGRDIRCKGMLNAVECHPFVPGKTYVVRGLIERNQPPKLLVDEFWLVDDAK